MKSLVIALALIVTTPFAHAMGDELRNGGRVLVCKFQDVTTYQLYDFWEATSFYHYTLKRDFTSIDPLVLVKDKIAEIGKYSPLRAALYSMYLENLENEVMFVTAPLETIQDIGASVYPSNCESVQAVSQLRKPQGGPRYYIQVDLWNNLSAYHRAGLLMHEFIYREGTSAPYNFKDSIGVRAMNAYLYSTKMGTDRAEYDHVTQCAGFKNNPNNLDDLNQPCR